MYFNKGYESAPRNHFSGSVTPDQLDDIFYRHNASGMTSLLESEDTKHLYPGGILQAPHTKKSIKKDKRNIMKTMQITPDAYHNIIRNLNHIGEVAKSEGRRDDFRNAISSIDTGLPNKYKGGKRDMEKLESIPDQLREKFSSAGINLDDEKYKKYYDDIVSNQKDLKEQVNTYYNDPLYLYGLVNKTKNDIKGADNTLEVRKKMALDKMKRFIGGAGIGTTPTSTGIKDKAKEAYDKILYALSLGR